MKIIVGLGNPGEKYRLSRHNAGWIFLDAFLGNPTWREDKKFNALTYKDGDFLFVKPLTFMNESGVSVRKLMSYYNLLDRRFGLFAKKGQNLKETLTIIQDELDLDFGSLKVSSDSGSAGHRGVASVITHLKTKTFKRLRLGIKNELLKTRIPADKFVMQNFSHQELADLQALASSYEKNKL